MTLSLYGDNLELKLRCDVVHLLDLRVNGERLPLVRFGYLAGVEAVFESYCFHTTQSMPGNGEEV